MKEVCIYADGACDPNPGPGGYGVVLLSEGFRRELSGGFHRTTNNRMELFGAIVGLEVLTEPCVVTLYSDSQYLVNAMTQGWARRWQANGWRRKGGAEVPNADLWERLLALCDRHTVRFCWVRGHASTPENNRADRLSCEARSVENLPIDEGFARWGAATTQYRTEDLSFAPSEDSDTSGRPSADGEHTAPLIVTPITEVGQPCRKCQTPVVKRIPKARPKPSQTYYYEYYLYCPRCRTMYMVEEAKRSRV